MEKYTERHVQAIWYDALEMMDYYLDLDKFTDNTTC